ncbi:MAG: YerC/YecD family TrpR-related protein [Patescibacteria group bacterium]
MKRRFTEDSWRREPWFKQLCSALLTNKSEADIASFLRDVATLSELQDLSERLEVARLLSKGLSYREVARLTGACTTTVTRVARSIENGEGGYRKFLNVHRHHRMMVKEAVAMVERQKGGGLKPASVLQKYLQK